ncbi:Thermophilic serine proteinase precursor [Phycisphaerae bacterium RAS1]|nr:Thermophilic serine proteinase precursor [Phycisphaerae bacterium RAS1]
MLGICVLGIQETAVKPNKLPGRITRLAWIAPLLIAAFAARALADGQRAEFARDRVIVRLAPHLRPAATDGPVCVDRGPIDASLAKWKARRAAPLIRDGCRNARPAAGRRLDRTFVIEVPAGSDTAAFAAELALAPGVEQAELDGLGGIASTIPNDPNFAVQWGLDNTGQLGGVPDADLDVPETWDYTTGAATVTIAIVDTGVQADHPDLAGKVLPGWNTYNNNSDTTDPHGHGTFVAGVAAAIGNNGVGVAGMNWNARILPVRCVSPAGSGTESQCAAAIVWATDNGADVISMSLQYYSGTALLRDAVAYAYDSGVLPIAAAGNGQGPIVAFPARFPKCMAVSATNRNDALWPGSNYGPEMDVSAPGQEVYSLWKNSGYQLLSGTSMATPHVSGLASLLLSIDPSLLPVELESALISTVTDLGPEGFDDEFGWGRVNALAAVRSVTPLGDSNCDGQVNVLDINAFVLALSDPAAYAALYPGCARIRADINGDGAVDVLDINEFVAVIAGA